MIDLRRLFEGDLEDSSTAHRAADAVSTLAAEAPATELPRGWPADVPPPDWWGEFCSILGGIKILAARAQVCGDSACAFPAMIEWESPGRPRQWSCPRCGRTADRG